MAMIYNSIPYFPTQVSFFEEVAMELIEARYGMKAETAVMKLVCKIYKENGYYMVWNEEQCTLFTNKVGREIAKEEMQGIVETLMEKGFFDKETYKEHGILTSTCCSRSFLSVSPNSLHLFFRNFPSVGEECTLFFIPYHVVSVFLVYLAH